MEHLLQVGLGVMVGILAGIGFVHLTVSGKVATNTTEIAAMRRDFDMERERTDSRIFEVVQLVKTSNELAGKVIGQNNRLIAAIEVQKMKG